LQKTAQHHLLAVSLNQMENGLTIEDSRSPVSKTKSCGSRG